mmetsp:Transcript_43846/g.171437  ORF Transcript_43846/g.171437 Transcript_43846/m.171437 type:complete len:272 (-) Transcript_43846:481-1296(-)
MLRDGVTGDWVGTFEGHGGAVWSACLSDDTFVAATGSADQSAIVWDAKTGDIRQRLPQKHVCKSVALSKDASLLLTGGLFSTVNLYDVSNPETPLFELPVGPVKFARFYGEQSEVIITGSTDGKLTKWDARNGQKISQVECGAEIRSGELRRNSDFLTLALADESVQFWDVRTMELIKKFKAPRGTESCSLQPSQEKYVLCGQDLSVRMYDYATGMELESHRGHHGPIMVVRFAPDGETYSTGADDGTIRIWKTNPQPNYPVIDEGSKAAT